MTLAFTINVCFQGIGEKVTNMYNYADVDDERHAKNSDKRSVFVQEFYG